MLVRQLRRNVFVLTVAVVVLVSGCVYHESTLSNMLSEINYIGYHKNASVSILWYHGSDNQFDYLSYVYSMSGTKRYKVPSRELLIDNRLQFTEDSSKWLLISEIKGKWSASRLYDGVWIEDRSGIQIQVVPSDQNKIE